MPEWLSLTILVVCSFMAGFAVCNFYWIKPERVVLVSGPAGPRPGPHVIGQSPTVDRVYMVQSCWKCKTTYEFMGPEAYILSKSWDHLTKASFAMEWECRDCKQSYPGWEPPPLPDFIRKWDKQKAMDDAEKENNDA